MCNQQEYVDFDKVNNIIINENKTEQVMLIYENYFFKAKLSYPSGKHIFMKTYPTQNQNYCMLSGYPVW